MNKELRLPSTRQRLGLRPGLEPYYTVVEQTPTQLVLRSRPGANRRAGYTFMARGVVLIVLGLLFFSAGYINLSEGMEDAGISVIFGTVVLGILGWFGLRGVVTGWAVASTVNQITVDQETGTITYTQSNLIIRKRHKRTQTLPTSQVTQLRLRRRSFVSSGILARRYPIMALELLTATGTVWLVDSAADAAMLSETATALSAVLGLPVEHAGQDAYQAVPAADR